MTFQWSAACLVPHSSMAGCSTTEQYRVVPANKDAVNFAPNLINGKYSAILKKIFFIYLKWKYNLIYYILKQKHNKALYLIKQILNTQN